MTIEKIVETDRGFILIGSFNSNSLPQGASALDFSTYPVFTDANGQEVLYDFATSQLDSPVEKPPAGSFRGHLKSSINNKLTR
ncbi:hypothetical protein [Candidatus Villigracilis saccharophilus]|uniref:hypothetical protein n=1 Tax=Candidatus Villigracilis saccharophilus TaxID=3140684 RepID=UPI0031373E02|nr:hypothetical protein [Anaerolineales bacterium]